MEYDKGRKEINLKEKELTILDKFVLDFVRNIDDYVIVSGYVSILLGRTRATEDIDLLAPKTNLEEFKKIWKRIFDGGFECINTSIVEEAFDMLKDHGIRFYKKIPLPNIEFKIIKNDLDAYSFKNRMNVILKEGNLNISPLELQIAYKLFLAQGGNEKDIEDAKHLYELFKEKINKQELLSFVYKLKVENEFKQIADEY